MMTGVLRSVGIYRLTGMRARLGMGALVLTLPALAQAAICHVSPAGGGDGSAWSNPASLAGALADANCTEIRLQQGTYTHTSSWVLNRDGVHMLGGYVGGAGADADQRAGPQTTVLDGEGARQVLYIDGSGGITSATLIEGLTIANGWRNSTGGGVHCDGSVGGQCSPIFRNMVFQGNGVRSGGGGAIYNDGSFGGTSSPSFENVTFVGNEAEYGGAVYNDGFRGTSSPQFTNVTFSGNVADQGGAVYSDVANPTYTHVTFHGNTANVAGDASLSAGDGVSTFQNSIVWGNSTGLVVVTGVADASLRHSIIEDGCAPWLDCDATVSGADPLLAGLADNGGGTLTHLIGTGSPAVDAADPALCPAADQRGVARPQGAGCDMGAVELLRQTSTPAQTTPVPTLSPWGLMLLGLMAAFSGGWLRRRRV